MKSKANWLLARAAWIVVASAGAINAAAQVPDEARRDLIEALGTPFMVFQSMVQDKLILSDQQKQKLEQQLHETIQRTMQFFQKIGGLKPEDQEKELGSYRQKAQENLAAFLKETLKAEQLKRLRQLALQQEGLFALGRPEIMAELAITDEQREQFVTIVQELQKRIKSLIQEAHSGGNPEEIQPKVMKIRKEHEGKIKAILSDAQRKKWKQLLGKPLPPTAAKPPAALGTVNHAASDRRTRQVDQWAEDRRLTHDPAVSQLTYNFARSVAADDGGSTWGPDTRLTNNRANSWAPSITISGNTVHLVWFDQKQSPAQPLDVEKKLDAVLKLLKLPIEPAPTGVMVPNPEAAAAKRAEQKLRQIGKAAPEWVGSGGDAQKLQAIMQQFERMAQPKLPIEAEKKLNEALRLLGLSPEPEGGDAGESPETFRKRVQAKAKKVQAAAPAWVQGGGDAAKLEAIMQEFERRIDAAGGASYVDKEKKLDEAMKLLGLAYTPRPPTGVPKIYYGDAMGLRVQQKMRMIQAALPEWAGRGGDPEQVEARLQEFERLMNSATRDWEIYYKRSSDGGTTWEPEVRLTSAPGLSHRPMIAAAGQQLHVVWFDDRDGNVEVYYKRSGDGGNTWGRDVRLTEAAGDSSHPAVALSRNYVHVVWFDQRDGSSEIYYKRKPRSK